MTHWQQTPSSPTSVDDLRYDGEGNRVEQRTVSGSTTTTTYYLLGGQEEVQIVSGGATTITKYYPIGNATHLPQPIKVGTTISYLATDGLDTVSEALDSVGTVIAQQLYQPYSWSRYSNGTMPTSKGFTGQRADAATGLDYYGARYYDPVVGQFTSADDVLPGDGLDPWGLSRYAYVEGNPIARNDPTGHCWLVCAAIAAVVVGVGVTLINAGYQQITTGHVDWNESVKTGVLAGAAVGLTIALGPVGTAIAESGLGAVAGTIATEGAADLAMTTAASLGERVAANAAIGGMMGAGEGFIQGALAGDRGGDLLTDTAAGFASGAVGGAAGTFGGPVLGGALGNMAGNVTGQLITDAKTGDSFDYLSLTVAGIWGGLGGHWSKGNSGRSAAVWNAASATGLDLASQFVWHQAKMLMKPQPAQSAPPGVGGWRGMR